MGNFASPSQDARSWPGFWYRTRLSYRHSRRALNRASGRRNNETAFILASRVNTIIVEGSAGGLPFDDASGDILSVLIEPSDDKRLLLPRLDLSASRRDNQRGQCRRFFSELLITLS